MSIRQKLGWLLLALIAAASVGALFLTHSRTQDMEKKQPRYEDRERAADHPAVADPRIVIRKQARILEIYDGAKLIGSYPVVFGFAPMGDKEKEGDGNTPEGDFYIFVKNARSKFHLGLGISYPSKEDASRGLSGGVITKQEHDDIVRAIDAGRMPPQKTALGGEIYIHGGGVARDWTWGCIAMTNRDIERVYQAVEVGTHVRIES